MDKKSMVHYTNKAETPALLLIYATFFITITGLAVTILLWLVGLAFPTFKEQYPTVFLNQPELVLTFLIIPLVIVATIYTYLYFKQETSQKHIEQLKTIISEKYDLNLTAEQIQILLATDYYNEKDNIRMSKTLVLWVKQYDSSYRAIPVLLHQQEDGLYLINVNTLEEIVTPEVTQKLEVLSTFRNEVRNAKQKMFIIKNGENIHKTSNGDIPIFSELLHAELYLGLNSGLKIQSTSQPEVWVTIIHPAPEQKLLLNGQLSLSGTMVEKYLFD